MALNNYLNKSKKIVIYCSVPIFDTWPKKWQLEKFSNYGLDLEIWSTEEIFYKLENIKAAASGAFGQLFCEFDALGLAAR